MFRKCLYTAMACSLACAAESFEKLPTGQVKEMDIEYGRLVAQPGHVHILSQHTRTGARTMHIRGGEQRQARINLTAPVTRETRFEFWMERWTYRPPFAVTVCAVTDMDKEVEIKKITNLSPGGYKLKVEGMLPAGTTALIIKADTNAHGGVLVDDLSLFTGPMVLENVAAAKTGVYPIMKRAPYNPVLGMQVNTRGQEHPLRVDNVSLRLREPESVARISLCTSNADGTEYRRDGVLGSGVPASDGSVIISSGAPLEGGTSWLWLNVEPSDKALVGSTVTIEDVELSIAGKAYKIGNAPVTQRIGYMLAMPGEAVAGQQDGSFPRPCVAFRIPGMIQSSTGALIACFDARYHHEGDLCADIDVAVTRSTDGGQTWTLPTVAMDSGPGHANGCGDPCILQDKSGRIWLQALACHFSGGASLWTSKTGFDEKSTGQWEMVYSDDDGKTWSREHLNPTRQIKKEEWTTILAGPGNGITLRDGTIVFPAQIWDRAASPRCMSTICYSKDGGKNWVYGSGVPHSTSECQVVELADGAIMINCRNENRQGNRIVYTTRDLGKTWQPHPTNNCTLAEPTCQGSIVKVDTAYGRLLLFSNPNSRSGRNNMSIRVSADDGMNWNSGYVYDSRRCMGYSCIAMTDANHVGITYETFHTNGKTGNRGIGFIRIPLETVVTGKEVPAK